MVAPLMWRLVAVADWLTEPFNRFFHDDMVDIYYAFALAVLNEAHERRQAAFATYTLSLPNWEDDLPVGHRELAAV